jgi:hypothetical protein
MAQGDGNAGGRASRGGGSFIQPKSPFLSQTEGEEVGVSETVWVSEILISATEAAKRCRAETGGVPEGFIVRLKEQYPEGVPTTFVNALIAKRKAGDRPARDYRAEAVVEGGGVDSGRAPHIEETGAEAQEKLA